jgi:catechol 2,3-dioxygenase-like lactoylglutathione lyase family enzyme
VPEGFSFWNDGDVLGELALRVNDLTRSTAFYVDVVGLEMFSDNSPEFVFLAIAEGVPGHPQILGLFDRKTHVGQETSTLDHFAFITADLETEKARLERLDVPYVDREFPNFGWRSIFFADPDGNTVEFVSVA